MNVNLKVDIGPIRMRNPVMVASGTFGYGEEYKDLIDLNRLGAIVTKGLTLRPREGNPPPRIVETPAGMLNAIGLENVGVAAFIEKKLPYLRELSLPVIVNINGETIKEYVELARILDRTEGVAGLEINISCPNVKAGGIFFGQDPDTTYEVVREVRRATRLPLIAKLTPNVTDITVIAREAVRAGADALSLVNTIIGMAVDSKRRSPKLANITGGLSGPAIKPIALRMVWQVAQVVDVPIIGQGGIMTAEDALEFIITGAKAIAVGTANSINPWASIEIIEGIEDYLIKNGIGDINDLVGSLRL